MLSIYKNLLQSYLTTRWNSNVLQLLYSQSWGVAILSGCWHVVVRKALCISNKPINAD